MCICSVNELYWCYSCFCSISALAGMVNTECQTKHWIKRTIMWDTGRKAKCVGMECTGNLWPLCSCHCTAAGEQAWCSDQASVFSFLTLQTCGHSVANFLLCSQCNSGLLLLSALMLLPPCNKRGFFILRDKYDLQWPCLLGREWLWNNKASKDLY